MDNVTIKLELSFDEVNLILKSLGQLPFNQVYELIGTIHQQANQQVQQSENNSNYSGPNFKLEKNE